MSSVKEQAINLIGQVPEEEMTFVISILQNIITMLEVKNRSNELTKFKAAAGHIEIDKTVVENYRLENMV